MSDRKTASFVNEAMGMVSNGLSVVPVKTDKKPTVPTWKRWQAERMTPAEVREHFTRGVSIALIGGAVSGNLECLDFDRPDLYRPFLDTIESINPDLRQRLTLRQKTPSGGYHLVYRCTAPVCGNTKLARSARYADGEGTPRQDVYIETRGEGGYFLVHPSYAVPHGGGPAIQYQLVGSFDSVPVISIEERAFLHGLARSFDEGVEAHHPEERTDTTGTDGDRPGDRFNREMDWHMLLTGYGWTPGGTVGDRQHWTRPGKTDGSISATLHPERGLYVFSTSTPLPTEKPLSKFSVFACYAHGGDFQEAARELARRYGMDRPATTRITATTGEDRLAVTGAPIPLPDLPAVELFDYRLLPERLSPWIQDIAERLQCPPDYVAVGAMVSLAAVIGRKIGIRPQQFTDWTVVPNLWGLIVGRPGLLKSPALESTTGPLDRLIADALEQFKRDQKEVLAVKAVGKLRAEAKEKEARKRLNQDPAADVFDLLEGDEIKEPVLRRYKTNDTTAASLGELLRQNPNGLLVYRDEMVSLLKGLDREDNADARGFFLTAWNGSDSYTLDRIGRGLHLHIDAACISLLGGTQPGKLAAYIHHAVNGGSGDDGLIQRFSLMVWPDAKAAWENIDRQPDRKAKNAAFDVFDKLDKLNLANIEAKQDTGFDGQPEGIPYLRFAPDALHKFSEWRTELETRLRSGELHPALESHFSKYRKLVPALALIIHLADGGIGPVTIEATLKALAWSQYLESHARRCYGSAVQAEVNAAKLILKKIDQGDLKPPFSSKDVWRPGWTGLDREAAHKGLSLLIDYGHLSKRTIETPGRPAAEYHLVEVSA